MNFYRLGTSLLVIAVCAQTVAADPAGTSSVDRTASRLNAEAQLAHYANYYAASAEVRDLGRRMTAAVEERAASQHIGLSSSMTDSDRRLVRRLETLQGDDFDVAYLGMIQGGTVTER